MQAQGHLEPGLLESGGAAQAGHLVHEALALGLPQGAAGCLLIGALPQDAAVLLIMELLHLQAALGVLAAQPGCLCPSRLQSLHLLLP